MRNISVAFISFILGALLTAGIVYVNDNRAPDPEAIGWHTDTPPDGVPVIGYYLLEEEGEYIREAKVVRYDTVDAWGMPGWSELENGNPERALQSIQAPRCWVEIVVF
jgi:hypothetical protein